MSKNYSANNESFLIKIICEAEAACNRGDYSLAEDLYTTAINLDNTNPSLYGNRSVTRFYLKHYEESLADAENAVQLDSKYAKGYFRLGVSHQCLEQYNAALIAFAKGMSLEPKNIKFLQALTDTALKSPLKVSLQPVLKQLNDMNLESNPFVITSVIGQDLLSHNDPASAVEVLECAITIGTYSMKLKGSVFSALSSALWTLENYDRAIYYMGEDLKTSQSLSDTLGECRAYGNLGAAHFYQNRLDAALENHQKQLTIAEKLHHKPLTASAHSGLGAVYASMGDHRSAVQHHENAADVYLDVQEFAMRCRELGKVAQSRLMLGDDQGALRCEKERLRICADKVDDGGKEEAHAYMDVAAVYKAMHKQSEEMACLQKSADISKGLGDTDSELKALLSLGYTARHSDNTSTALTTYQRLLEIALNTNNKPLECRACANLGIVYHQVGNFDMALKLQVQCLEIAIETGDEASQGRAFGNIGNAYSASGLYEQAVNHHLKELEISHRIHDKESECSTHGNLAVAYQALQLHDKAVDHYKSQYELAKEIGNTSNQSRALMNLGNFYNTLNQYCQAIDFYKKYLELLKVAPDKSGEGRALYNLGFACYSLHDFEEAVSCYERSVIVASECQDKVAMARAYCNLGLAKKALREYGAAFDCQNMFLSLSTELKSTRGTFKAFGNLGDIYIAKKDPEQAVGFYQQQLTLSEQQKDPLLVAQACSSLGGALRSIGQLEQAVLLHAKETSIYSTVLKQPHNEYKALGRHGATLTALGRYTEAVKCYERQLELSKITSDSLTEAQAWGNLAITYNNLGEFAKAKTAFESQIEILEELPSKSARLEKCRAYCNIGDCAEALEQYHESAGYYQVALVLSNELKNLSLVERSYKGLSSAMQQLGKINSAITYCEQRLNVCERIGNQLLLATTYGELGILYSLVKKFDDALYCLNLQMRLAVETNNENLKGDAACGLGGVYLLMKDYEKALTFHKLDLELAQRNDNRPCQGRAYGNIASTHEAMGNYALAIPNQEQHLFIAKEQDDEVAKLNALHGIGRNTLRLPGSDYSRAVLLLQQAMLLCHGIKNNEEMISTTFDLGIAMWACGDLHTASAHITKAVEMAEAVCVDAISAIASDINSPSISVLRSSYKLLAQCYTALICVLCEDGHIQLSLEMVEKLRSFPDRLLANKTIKRLQTSVSVEKMLGFAREQDCIVVYYAIIAGHLFQWFISPEGQVQLAGCISLLHNPDKDCEATTSNNDCIPSNGNILSKLLLDLQDTLGLISEPDDSEDAPNLLSDSRTQSGEETLYLDLLDIQASLRYDIKHVTTGKGCLLTISDSHHNLEKFMGKQPFYALYDLLLSKCDNLLKSYARPNFLPKLLLIAEGELLLVPFSMLKKRTSDHFLGQNFILNMATTFQSALGESRRISNLSLTNYRRCVSFGNPTLPDNDQNWIAVSAAENEARFVSQIFRCEAVMGSSVNKSVVMSDAGSSEVLHFACPVSWKYPVGVVVDGSGEESLLDNDFADLSQDKRNKTDSLSRCLLSTSDVLSLDLSGTKLVVLGSPYLLRAHGDYVDPSSLSKSIASFAHCLLLKGAKAVLFSLWPVPETASKLFLQTFYKSLAKGQLSMSALAIAKESLRNSEQFQHPSYWAAFTMVGQDFCLDSIDLSTNHALLEVLQGRPALAKEALKLVLHLHEKVAHKDSTAKNRDAAPMYISQESISKRLQDTRGWRELFTAAAFQLRSSSNGLPDALFFPANEDKDILEVVAKQIGPFLNLPDEALSSIGKLKYSPHTASSLRLWMDDNLQFCDSDKEDILSDIEAGTEFLIGRKIWQTDGVFHLLASLGLSVIHINEDDVTLYNKTRLNNGKVIDVVEVLHTLFGHVTSIGNLVKSNLFIEPEPTTHNTATAEHLYLNNHSNTQNSKSLPHGVLLPDHVDLHVDFSASSRSIGSEGSSKHQGSLEQDSVKDEFGVLPLEEPKLFTKVPKNTGLIAPKPILPQKSNVSSPVGSSSSPGGAFSPTRKYHYKTSSSPMHSKSPSSTKSGDLTPSKNAWSPLNLPSPTSLPMQSPQSVTKGKSFYHGSHNPDAKVCVVSPQRENSPQVKTTHKFMSVFESMLAKTNSPTSEKSSSRSSPAKRESLSSTTPVNMKSKIYFDDTVVDWRSSNASTPSSYKPSPSAASALRSNSPQYEYSHIADKLSRGDASNPRSIDVSQPQSNNVTSTSSTHTAFRLINTNQDDPFGKPKLLKYRVQTQISTVSTLLSEEESHTHPLEGNITSLQHPHSSQSDKARFTSKLAVRTQPKPSDIFQHLGALKLDSSDERVEFV